MASDNPPSRTPGDASDRCFRELKFDNWVFAVDWSPDGNRLAIGDFLGAIEVFTAEGRRLWRRAEHQGKVMDIRWSPDGRRLACADTGVILFDTDTGEKLDGWSMSGEYASGVSWSPDGSCLAAGFESDRILSKRSLLLSGWRSSGNRQHEPRSQDLER